MKILYISNSVIPSRTANSIHVMKMCQAFTEIGHDVVLLAPDKTKSYEKNINDIYEFYGVKKNFKIEKLWHPNLKGGILIYLFGILLYLTKHKKYNLVYGRFLHGCYLASLLKKKVIFETHEIIHKKKKNNLFFFKKLITSKYFLKLIVISKALKNIYLEKPIMKNINIQVAHDGADEVKNFSSKVNLKGPENILKVGYVGHLYKGRGIEIIIECAKRISDISFHLVGGMESDIEYWKNNLSLLNLNNIFFYGFKSPNETLKYRNSFDIFLAPYSNQVSVFGNSGDTSRIMSPLKIFEYMSHQKPIIASDITVLKEVLNNKNSILVKYDDINGWVNAINLLRQKQKRKQLAFNAYKDFKKYSWNNRAFDTID